MADQRAAQGYACAGRIRAPIDKSLELPDVGHALLLGHSIQLIVASSLHPLYAVDLGGPENLAGTETRPATNVAFHDPAHPSRLKLLIGGIQP